MQATFLSSAIILGRVQCRDLTLRLTDCDLKRHAVCRTLGQGILGRTTATRQLRCSWLPLLWFWACRPSWEAWLCGGCTSSGDRC